MGIMKKSAKDKKKTESEELIKARGLSKSRKMMRRLLLYLFGFILIFTIIFSYTKYDSNSKASAVRTNVVSDQVVNTSQPLYISILQTVVFIGIIAFAIYRVKVKPKK